MTPISIRPSKRLVAARGGRRLAPLAWALLMVFAACGEPTSSAGPALDGQLLAAQSELDAGHAQAASAAFRNALEADPSSIEARLGLAASAVQLGDLSGAQKAYEEVLGLGADSEALTKALTGLADLRHRAGDETAARDFETTAAALRGEAPAP